MYSILRFLFCLALGTCLISTFSACEAEAGDGNEKGNAAPTQAQVDAAFEKEWEAWKLSKYESLSQEQRDELWLRGAGDPKDIIDQSLERQAKGWKGDLESEFAKRFEGYQKLAQRLRDENHPNPQQERTKWFDALVSEVRQQ